MKYHRIAATPLSRGRAVGGKSSALRLDPANVPVLARLAYQRSLLRFDVERSEIGSTQGVRRAQMPLPNGGVAERTEQKMQLRLGNSAIRHHSGQDLDAHG